MINRILAAGLLALLLTGCAKTPATPLDANAESRALAAYIQNEYGDWTRDYIHVYLGYAACKYSFIDEEVLNSLADDTLKKMFERAVELIRAEHRSQAGGLSDAAVRYAAQMAVLTTAEMHSNAVSAEILPSYQGEDADCSLSAQKNQVRYKALQEFDPRRDN